MNIAENLAALTGNTPLVMLKRLCDAHNTKGMIAAKLESFNPGGSAKDRAAKYMLDDAEKRGLIEKGAVIIEPTSGNTGIGLALAGRLRGYRVVLTMPDSMSKERISLLKAYGAELVLTDGALGMKGAIDKANELARSTENSFIPGQFSNVANARAHYETTGPELWRDSDGKVACVVAGVGTGATLSGTGRFLKEQNPEIKIVAVEPSDSPVLSGGKPGAHKLQGIGAGFVPEICDVKLFDEIITISTEQAYSCCRELTEREAILAGVSSGAVVCAALQLAKKSEYADKLICVILPDTGERYLSVEGLYSVI